MYLYHHKFPYKTHWSVTPSFHNCTGLSAQQHHFSCTSQNLGDFQNAFLPPQVLLIFSISDECLTSLQPHCHYPCPGQDLPHSDRSKRSGQPYIWQAAQHLTGMQIFTECTENCRQFGPVVWRASCKQEAAELHRDHLGGQQRVNAGAVPSR